MSDHIKQKINIFLFGMLSGVLLVATFTYVFAIPANDYHWQSEIFKRGGAAWTYDMKSGRAGWKWLVEPKADISPQKPAAMPLSKVNVRIEKL